MEIIDDLSSANLNSDTIITVGAFDGVHRGHQLPDPANGGEGQTNEASGWLDHLPSPSWRGAFALLTRPRYLSTPGEKAALLERLDLDILAILPLRPEDGADPRPGFRRANPANTCT